MALSSDASTTLIGGPLYSGQRQARPRRCLGIFRAVRAGHLAGQPEAQASTSGGTKVTISGLAFTGATAVDFGSKAASFTVDSDTQITATSPTGTGTVDVTVTAPGGTSLSGSPDRFTYVHALAIALVPPGQTAEMHATVTATTCASTKVKVKVTQQNVPGSSKLKVSSHGDTSGLRESLSSASLLQRHRDSDHHEHRELDRDRYVHGHRDQRGLHRPATATLTVNHTGLAVAQGVYVTQGTQTDFGHLSPEVGPHSPVTITPA